MVVGRWRICGSVPGSAGFVHIVIVLTGKGEKEASPSRSAIGGAAGEAGNEYRAAVTAVLMAHALRGWDVRGVELPAEVSVPRSISVETDDPVDDIGCALSRDGYAYIQAKRSLQLSSKPGRPLSKAMAQFRAAVETLPLDSARHRLVLATANPTGPIRDLGKALRRRRIPLSGAPSTAEKDALDRLSLLLVELSPEKRDLLLECLVIWECDAGSRTAHEAERASLLLDNTIVPVGSGERAFKALKDAARDLGRLREGVDLEGMIEILRGERLELLGDADGATALQLVARQRAEAGYRQRLQRDGKSISLLGVGAGTPDLELADVDAKVNAVEPGVADAPQSERDVAHLIRRRGRLLLIGLPGSGKSTALRRAAAEQAAMPRAPLPLFIDLKKLAIRIESEAVLDVVVDIACAGAPQDERAALHKQVVAAIEDGNVTMYLDALDETRTMRASVVAAIAELLRHRSRSLEVILATRDAGVVAGRALGFKEARLSAPSNVDETVSSILAAIACHRQVGDPLSWAQERERWVKDILARDSDLQATPLMPILLAVSAAGHTDSSKLPDLRAEILKQIVRDVVDRWEAGRSAAGALHLGSLGGMQAAEALFGCFAVEGSLLADEGFPTVGAVMDRVCGYLEDGWSLPTGEARAGAREALAFWDEAGFFLRTADEHLEARVRLFSELAEALHWVEKGPEACGGWVADSLSDPEKGEALKLAAGLSRGASDALMGAASTAAELRPLQLAADAMSEGASVSPKLIDPFVDALLEIVARGGEEGVEAAGLLVTSPVPGGRQKEAAKIIAQCLPSEDALIAQVRADVNWKVEKSAEVLARFAEVLEMKPPRPAVATGKGKRAKGRIVFGIPATHAGWADAVAGAAEALVPDSPKAAQLAAPLVVETGAGASERISAALQAAGYGDLVQEQYKRLSRSFRSISKWRDRKRRADEAEIALLEVIAEIDEPGELTVRQRRALDELIDLLYTLGIPDSPAGQFDALALDVPAAMKILVHAVACLGDFDRPRLAAEARLAIAELGNEETTYFSGMFFIPGVTRETSHWDELAHPKETRDDLIRVLKTFGFAASTAAIALHLAPPELEVAECLLSRKQEFKGRSRRLALLVALSLLPETRAVREAADWNSSEDSFGRMAIASFAAQSLDSAEATRSLVEETIEDVDAAVRAETIRYLRGDHLDPDLREQVSKAAEGATIWTCMHCGAQNAFERNACRKCKTSAPDLERHAEDLLSGNQV